MARIEPYPVDFKTANEMVSVFHRHHKPCVGHKFSVGAAVGGSLMGVAIVGRPVAFTLDPQTVIEVLRLVVAFDEPHVCSFLYSRCARIAKEFGYHRIQTYILESEPGTSLKAAGWAFSHTTQGGDWNHSASRKGTRRTDQPMCPKQCWFKNLR